MTDTTVIEEKPPESPPAELPAAAQSDSWDQVKRYSMSTTAKPMLPIHRSQNRSKHQRRELPL